MQKFILSFAAAIFIFGAILQHQVLSKNTPVSTEESTIHYVDDFTAINPDGTVNAVIEIPAGTNEKWEVTPENGKFALEHKNGKPRIVAYLGYPGNYGMVPQTRLLEELGGDGDPLDILVIGGPAERGSIVKAKIIGILKFLDQGEQDDKLIAVLSHTALYDLNSFEDMNSRFPEMLTIIRLWFENYKGPGIMIFQGEGSAEEAIEILKKAATNYRQFKSKI